MDKKILIIDDSEDQRLLFRIELEQYSSRNFTVLEANNTKDGLALILGEEPELVVLDQTLPGSSGLTLLNDIRKLREEYAAAGRSFRFPHIFFLSCVMSESLRRNAKALGASECMEKTDLAVGELAVMVEGATA